MTGESSSKTVRPVNTRRRVRAFITLLLALMGTSAFAQSRPNLVLILADDYGLDCVGCYGSDQAATLTPNIDRLAAAGIRFTHCYSAPLCGPSRCTINTGRYVFRRPIKGSEQNGP